MQARGSGREREQVESVFGASMESVSVWFGQLCVGEGHSDEGSYLWQWGCGREREQVL